MSVGFTGAPEAQSVAGRAFDRIRGDPDAAAAAVLYADITSIEFAEHHRALSKLAEEGTISYRLRHIPSPTGYERNLSLGGYGAALSVKRTDYIVVDDRSTEDAQTAGQRALVEEAKDSIHTIFPLPASEIRTLGIKLASHALLSPDPLGTLLRVTKNFPQHTAEIPDWPISNTFLDELRIRQMSELPPGANLIWLNGLGIDDRHFHGIGVLQQFRKERHLVEGLIGTGLNAAEAIESLAKPPDPSVAGAPAPPSPKRYNSTIFAQLSGEHSSFSLGDPDTALFQIVSALDPVSELGQQWIQLLSTIVTMPRVYLKVYLNPVEDLDILPLKRFYDYVFHGNPDFDERTGALTGPSARFFDLPKETLLTTALDVPPAWVVAPSESRYDLDNLVIPSNSVGRVNASYALRHILLDGHTQDITFGRPPQGAQLILRGGEQLPSMDTIIMANLGYFQFKANPGVWALDLKSGRSQQIYRLNRIRTRGRISGLIQCATNEIDLIEYEGITAYPELERQIGQEQEDVLDEGGRGAATYASAGLGFANKVLSKLSRKKSEHAQINIFSVASGHLYERMLNIMIVSVMKHTKHTVKFWFIEQFLSPSFTEFLPSMAEAYNFDYELVAYKWPHWLRQQTEKQREIWGYKILFLDVLFPLSLEKIIFVDADQVVRTDLYDLTQVDLEGAPYGFTPMCDSRSEMEGFRFWKKGYWKTYLSAGAPGQRLRPSGPGQDASRSSGSETLKYHISALYVVDLKQFRHMAAGDRLRQSYQTLSSDPASLANLDQDLPNHCQRQGIPIKSLEQDWLWCETWCADDGLARAKTIDLCNNPLTKEPKLSRARRLLPEWNEYDEEIRRLMEKLRGESGAAVEMQDAITSGGVRTGPDDGNRINEKEL